MTGRKGPSATRLAGRALPIRRLLALYVLLVTLMIAVLVAIAGLGLRAASAIRAYVGGEGLWSKAEKDAIYALATYAATGEPADYQHFQSALTVPLGDRAARLELESAEPRLRRAADGFLAGRNHPEDVKELIWMFRRFRHVSYLERAVAIWEEGDIWIAKLQEIGGELHEELKRGPLPEPRQRLYVRRIAEVNARVTRLEDDFSYTLGEAARWVRSLVMWVILGVSTVLVAVAAAAAYAIAGTLKRGEETVRQALAQAESASRTKSSFLGLVSHELRTPLNALQLQIERLRRDRTAPLTAKQSDITARMSSTTRRLADMVSALLEYIRIEGGGLQLALTSVPLGPLVSEALEEMRLVAQQKGLALQIETAPEMPHVVTDPQLLRFVITNLVGNAVKFTSEGGIHVSLSFGATGHRITVTDTGPGIAPEDHARVFEPFEQLEAPGGRQPHGIGLGLSLVREITAALGACVELTSAPGQGSRFTVVIPPPAAGARVA